MPKLHSMREALPLLLLAACLGCFHPAWSQEVTAAVTGSVVDPTWRKHRRRDHHGERYRTSGLPTRCKRIRVACLQHSAHARWHI